MIISLVEPESPVIAEYRRKRWTKQIKKLKFREERERYMASIDCDHKRKK